MLTILDCTVLGFGGGGGGVSHAYTLNYSILLVD